MRLLRVLLVILSLFLSTLLFWLLWVRVQLDEVSVAHPDNILMMHLFMDLELSAFVLLVLLELLDGNDFARRLQRAHEHLRESALPTLDLLCELVRLLKV